jgi:hypothetical protein
VIFMWSWALYLVELVDVVIQILCYSRALSKLIIRLEDAMVRKQW